MGKRNGFNLAEVLITLGVIGVVAAITMPTLIRNHKKKIVETKLKETLSIFNQAQIFSYTENGSMSGWDVTLDNESFIKKYYAPYLKIRKTIPIYNQESSWYTTKKERIAKAQAYANNGDVIQMSNATKKYILNNGVGFFLQTNYASEFSWNGIRIPIDLMVSNKEAKYGIDFFLLPISNKKSFSFAVRDACKLIKDNAKTNKGKTFYEHCATGDKHYEYGDCCSAIIQCNDWKIPDDYPIRF